MSKKVSLIILSAILVLAMVIPSNTVFAVSDKKVTSVNAVYENGKLTVSGEVEAGMLAVAVQVYDENDQFVKLETGAVDSNNKYKVEITLPEAKYIVKVADFDGGETVSKIVNDNSNPDEENVNPDETNETAEETDTETATTPKTGDNISMYFAIFGIGICGVITIVLLNRRKLRTRKIAKH